jgi:glycosyltransferase involved in cell wall biosynthesis
MNILITLKLSDLNLHNHLYPLTKIDEINEIFIVRDYPGPKIEKVKYYCPPSWSLGIAPVCFLIKFFIMIYISLKYKTNIVLGYLLFPHGLLAFFAGKITRKRTGVNLIAGPVEFFSTGSPEEAYAYTRELPDITIYGKIMSIICRRFDIFIANGEYTRQFLKKIGIHQKRIHILYKPMKIELSEKNSLKVIDIIFLGRLAKVKHVENIIKIAYYVKKEIPGVKVGVVGDGPEYSNLINLSNNLSLSDTVTFYGWQNDPIEWLDLSKISVLTSEREGFPQSVMQSLYCGVPVVSSMCGDVVDLIQTGYNGILIRDHNDIQSFVTPIICLLQHPDILYEYSRNSERSVKDRDLMAEAIDTWRDILNIIH